MKTGGHKGILCVYLLSLPVRGAWIEIDIVKTTLCVVVPSLPVRGAWIEMGDMEKGAERILVAPCEGSVD